MWAIHFEGSTSNAARGVIYAYHKCHSGFVSLEFINVIHEFTALTSVEQHQCIMGVVIYGLYDGIYSMILGLAFGPLFNCGELWKTESYLGVGVCTL